MMPYENDGIRTPSRYMIEPDYIASECDDQLPLLSKIGRGPRGKGVYAEVVEGVDSVRIDIKSDETGEVIASTSNLYGGRVSVSQDPKSPVSGDRVRIDFSVHRGTDVQTFPIWIGPGATGSRIYLLEERKERTRDDTYQTTVESLTIYGKGSWPSKPDPRPNDVVLFNYSDKGEIGFAFGTIEAVENGQVVFTSRVFNAIPGVEIGGNGHWFVDGEDTGQSAQGPSGQNATLKVRREGSGVVLTANDADGSTSAMVQDGKDGRNAEVNVQRGDRSVTVTATDVNGTTTAIVYDGANGKDGEDGISPTLTLGSVQETVQPQVTVTPGRVNLNEYVLSFGLPRGADGKSVDIQGGVYKISDLPDFDETEVNTAFIVNDADNVYDLYIRGRVPVIAEEGGPWTVVENWQGMQGYSFRLLNGHKISQDAPVSIPKDEVDSAFTPSTNVQDGDIVLDADSVMGVVGSSHDDSGAYTVSYVANLQVKWSNVSEKPVLAKTDSIDLAETDGTVTAALRLAQSALPNTTNDSGNELQIVLDHTVTENGLTGHLVNVLKTHFKADENGIVSLSDDVVSSMSKADSAVQQDDLNAAIAAESEARSEADQAIEAAVSDKLDASDLIAGENVTIVPNPDTGQVTISATGGGSSALPVASADTLGGVKPSDQILVSEDGAMSIAHDAVSYNEIANNSIMVSHLTDLCVSATKIQNNAIGTNKIVDKAVTSEKIADGVIPDTSALIAKPSSGNGSSGQMLVTNGDGSTQWVDVPDGTAYIAGDGLQIQNSEISIRTSNVSTVAVGGGSEDVVTFNMDHVFGPEDGAMQGHSLRADASFFDHASNVLTLKSESITADQLSQNINVSKFSNDAGYQNLAQVNEAVSSSLGNSTASLEDFRSYMGYVAS